SIQEYVKTNFPREIITKIERERSGMKIELSNDYSLKFNKKGKFVSIDD
ncbi:PepSY-like domain-containing protein, partial [Bacteroides heparinolyticus]